MDKNFWKKVILCASTCFFKIFEELLFSDNSVNYKMFSVHH
jgi:hypothetical protein